ncbi:single-stranded DNA-binding protein [Streptococcus pneumoniae]|uniref:SSB domain protein n=1 Tax=Streptococcus phage phiARI0746 TaxID=1701837 RepID=A0A141DZG3_9CAUD|nr:single-stranded DNA-binding protein [Streptococcus pneumoniae]YP_009321532.1 single strand DNA binding protein [Streptococcus phage phiARI0746]ALA46872.1 SSB domain protein [Streptococcus phage phiARI0746]CEW12435.1 single-strand binding protein [Streptococcus pneumoniae]CEW67092.1 single-strand binding protein [Streptococcus pneumoniae]CEZ04487.1 single-strand binding protein [Streptococcus pneumoniae]CGF26923.1 single-strand binding protein [Streptococcus pneumoniae]
MINNVVLVGRLTRDAELRYTQSNIAVATFTLAVNRPFKNEAGEREADFINCVIWRQLAENLANWAKKGSLIGVTGVIQTRSYDNQQGQRVYVTEVVASNFQLLESRNSQHNNQGHQDHHGGYQQQGYSNQGSSFQNGNSYGQQGIFFEGNTTNPVPDFTRDNNPFGRPTNPLDISNDDLPF